MANERSPLKSRRDLLYAGSALTQAWVGERWGAFLHTWKCIQSGVLKQCDSLSETRDRQDHTSGLYLQVHRRDKVRAPHPAPRVGFLKE